MAISVSAKSLNSVLNGLQEKIQVMFTILHTVFIPIQNWMNISVELLWKYIVSYFVVKETENLCNFIGGRQCLSEDCAAL